MTTTTMVEFTRELLAGKEVVVDSWQTEHRVTALKRMLQLFPELLEADADDTKGREIWTLRRKRQGFALAGIASRAAEIAPDNDNACISSERSESGECNGYSLEDSR